jgi:hypothetical protein
MSDPDINQITAYLFRFFKTHKSKFTIFEHLNTWPPDTLHKTVYPYRNVFCGNVYFKIEEILQVNHVEWKSSESSDSSDIFLFYIFSYRPTSGGSKESGYVSLHNNKNEVDKKSFNSLKELEIILLKLFDITIEIEHSDISDEKDNSSPSGDQVHSSVTDDEATSDDTIHPFSSDNASLSDDKVYSFIPGELDDSMTNVWGNPTAIQHHRKQKTTEILKILERIIENGDKDTEHIDLLLQCVKEFVLHIGKFVQHTGKPNIKSKDQ